MKSNGTPYKPRLVDPLDREREVEDSVALKGMLLACLVLIVVFAVALVIR